MTAPRKFRLPLCLLFFLLFLGLTISSGSSRPGPPADRNFDRPATFPVKRPDPGRNFPAAPQSDSIDGS